MPKWAKGQSGNPGGRKKLQWKDELEKAILKRGEQLHRSPFNRLAHLFFTDNAAAIGILGHFAPKLKAVEVKMDSESKLPEIHVHLEAKESPKDKKDK